jgi:DNA helicase HerA-like ATPase
MGRDTVWCFDPLLIGAISLFNKVIIIGIKFLGADDNGWLLLDLKDLRAMLKFVADNAAEFRTLYGNISSASVGAIQRRLIGLEDQGGGSVIFRTGIEFR